jgi:hypothetical protein
MSLYGKRLAVSQRDNAHFKGLKTASGVGSQIGSFGGMIGGLLGSLVGAAVSTGKGSSLVKTYNLQDPSHGVRQALASYLIQSNRMQYLNNTATLTDENVVEMSKMFQGSDYLLDIKTVDWSIDNYVAELSLIDTHTSKAIGRGTCAFNANTHSTTTAGLNKATLLANNAAYLKLRLGEAQQYCANQFMAILSPARQ